MYLFKSKNVSSNSKTEQPLFYLGDQDSAKLASANAKQQYEDLCHALVKKIAVIMHNPCTDYKTLVHSILTVIEKESKKIADVMGFNEKFCKLRKMLSFKDYVDCIKTDKIADDMKLKITLLTQYDKQHIKKYLAHGYDQLAMGLRTNRVSKGQGVIPVTLPAKDGNSRYTFKIYTQTSFKFKYIPTGREEVLGFDNAQRKLKNIDQSQYVITPLFGAMDEALNYALSENILAVESGIYKDYFPKDIIVGDIEILYKNTWLLVSRHLTGRFGDDKASLVDKDIPCVVIRSEVDVVEPLIEMIAINIEKVLNKNAAIDDIHMNIASIIHLLELSCPYFLANTHATRIIVAACYDYHNLHLRCIDEVDELWNHAMYSPWHDRFVKKASAVLKKSCGEKKIDSEKQYEQMTEKSSPSSVQ